MKNTKKYEMYYELDGKPMRMSAEVPSNVGDPGALAHRFHATMQNRNVSERRSELTEIGVTRRRVTTTTTTIEPRESRESYRLMATYCHGTKQWTDDFASMKTPDYGGSKPFDSSFGSPEQLKEFPGRLAESE